MKKPCAYPGCNSLIERGRLCDTHAPTAPKSEYERWRKSDAAQSIIDRFRSTSAWQRVRALKVSANPLCEDPFGSHARVNDTASGRQVHHIKPLWSHFDLRLDADNLMSVCWQCHSRLESDAKRDKAGR